MLAAFFSLPTAWKLEPAWRGVTRRESTIGPPSDQGQLGCSAHAVVTEMDDSGEVGKAWAEARPSSWKYFQQRALHQRLLGILQLLARRRCLGNRPQRGVSFNGWSRPSSITSCPLIRGTRTANSLATHPIRYDGLDDIFRR